MLRSVSRVNPRADSPHVPVLHREVVSLARPGARHDRRRRHVRRRRPRAPAGRRDGRPRLLHRDRPRPRRQGALRRLPARPPDLRTRFVRGNFALALRNLVATGVRADAILLDLGISSMQIDQAERGFAYATDAPLDMRMDPSDPRTAADLVNELRRARRWRGSSTATARSGTRRRSPAPSSAAARRSRSPAPATWWRPCGARSRRRPSSARATRPSASSRPCASSSTTSSARSRTASQHALEMLKPGGRMGVISFHSLEDRIVKTFMRDGARGCVCPPDLPICGCGREPLLRVLTPRVVRPGEIEIEDNPRVGVGALPRRRADRRGAARHERRCQPRRPPSPEDARASAAASRRCPAAARAHPRGRPRRVVLELRDRRHRRRCCCAAS